MPNDEPQTIAGQPVFAHPDGRQSDAAADIARGAMRLLASLNFTGVMELTLNGWRRADIAALGPKGEIWIIEIKSSLADFASDSKWPEYHDHCDRLFFAVNPAFPIDVLPDAAGLIMADRYSGEIIREAPEARLTAARRKDVTLRIARAAAQRLHGLIDPDYSSRAGPL